MSIRQNLILHKEITFLFAILPIFITLFTPFISIAAKQNKIRSAAKNVIGSSLQTTQKAVKLKNAPIHNYSGVSYVNYAGYSRCILLENSTTKVILSPHCGGRILEYSYKGKNAIYLDKRQNGWIYKPDKPIIKCPSGGPGLVLDRKYKYKNFQFQTFHSIYAEFITV